MQSSIIKEEIEKHISEITILKSKKVIVEKKISHIKSIISTLNIKKSNITTSSIEMTSIENKITKLVTEISTLKKQVKIIEHNI